MNETFLAAREKWVDEYTAEQKLAFAATCVLTAARPVLSGSVSVRGFNKSRPWSFKDSAVLGTAYATDLEGNLARAMGVESELGARLDPIADKLASNPQELVLAYRKEEAWSRVGLRLARDIGLSGLRRYALKKTDGQASVKANWTGKVNTALRQSSIIFATSPLGEKYPGTRRALQIATTATTLASGAITAYGLLRQIEHYNRHESKMETRE